MYFANVTIFLQIKLGKEKAMKNSDNKNNNGLSRDEILECSRTENKNGDERQKKSILSARGIAYIVGFLVTAIVWDVEYAVYGNASAGLALIMAAMVSVDSNIRYFKIKQRKYLIEMIVGIIITIIGLSLWICELIGVL